MDAGILGGAISARLMRTIGTDSRVKKCQTSIYQKGGTRHARTRHLVKGSRRSSHRRSHERVSFNTQPRGHLMKGSRTRRLCLTSTPNERQREGLDRSKRPQFRAMLRGAWIIIRCAAKRRPGRISTPVGKLWATELLFYGQIRHITTRQHAPSERGQWNDTECDSGCDAHDQRVGNSHRKGKRGKQKEGKVYKRPRA
jgi:hypothetical protein